MTMSWVSVAWHLDQPCEYKVLGGSGLGVWRYLRFVTFCPFLLSLQTGQVGKLVGNSLTHSLSLWLQRLWFDSKHEAASLLSSSLTKKEKKSWLEDAVSAQLDSLTGLRAGISFFFTTFTFTFSFLYIICVFASFQVAVSPNFFTSYYYYWCWQSSMSFSSLFFLPLHALKWIKKGGYIKLVDDSTAAGQVLALDRVSHWVRSRLSLLFSLAS